MWKWLTCFLLLYRKYLSYSDDDHWKSVSFLMRVKWWHQMIQTAVIGDLYDVVS